MLHRRERELVYGLVPRDTVVLRTENDKIMVKEIAGSIDRIGKPLLSSVSYRIPERAKTHLGMIHDQGTQIHDVAIHRVLPKLIVQVCPRSAAIRRAERSLITEHEY